MATESVIHHVGQSKPAVVPFPKVISEQVTQAELSELLDSRSLLAQLEAEVQQQEASVRARLEAGASVEAGARVAELKENFRRNVSWREVVVRLAERLKLDGEAYCAKVLASTKPSRTVSLVIK
jgi:hypothetical protein